MITPFANDSESMQIGELIIENQQDKVTIYGDIDIYHSTEGLAQARQLQELMTKIVDKLSADNQASKLSKAPTGKLGIAGEDSAQTDADSEQIDNPFL